VIVIRLGLYDRRGERYGIVKPRSLPDLLIGYAEERRGKGKHEQLKYCRVFQFHQATRIKLQRVDLRMRLLVSCCQWNSVTVSQCLTRCGRQIVHIEGSNSLSLSANMSREKKKDDDSSCDEAWGVG
jgi:hypothetical protein